MYLECTNISQLFAVITYISKL